MSAWKFRVGYMAGALIVLGFEIIAIVNSGRDDTITENVRNVIFLHPVVWYSLLGLYLGFGAWMTRHFWWRKQ